MVRFVLSGCALAILYSVLKHTGTSHAATALTLSGGFVALLVTTLMQDA